MMNQRFLMAVLCVAFAATGSATLFGGFAPQRAVEAVISDAQYKYQRINTKSELKSQYALDDKRLIRAYYDSQYAGKYEYWKMIKKRLEDVYNANIVRLSFKKMKRKIKFW